MRTLRRPMFRKGGSANEGIMHGLEDRSGYAGGGRTIGGGTIQGTPMGYRTGFQNPTVSQIKAGIQASEGTQFTQSYLDKQWDDFKSRLFAPVAGITEMDIAYGMQVPYKHSDNQLALMQYIENNEEQAKKEFLSGELEGTTKDKDYYQLRDDQIKAFEGAEIKFDKEMFGYTPEKEVIPPGEEGGPGYVVPEVKEKTTTGGTGTIDDISVSDLNKERMKIFAPHMQKRMINNALSAASESFEKSTGDTKQDIARAISAAAKGMSGAQDIYDKVAMMTLTGEIQKDIEKSKEKKLGNYEFLYEKAMSEDPKDREWANTMIKQEDKKTYEYYLDKTQSTDSASRLWAKNKYPDVVQTFSASEDVDEDFIKKLKDGVYYIGIGKDGDKFFKVEGGKLEWLSRSGVL